MFRKFEELRFIKHSDPTLNGKLQEIDMGY